MGKRKSRLIQVREPNGRPQRPGKADQQVSPGEALRLRGAALIGLRDKEWGTELGRLCLSHKITEPMFRAGEKWRERAAKYGAALNSPGQPRSLNIGEGGMGKAADPDTEEGRRAATRDLNAVLSFREAHAVLNGAGALAAKMVRQVCEDDQRPDDHESLLALTRGLLWLAGYWHLTDSRKSMSDRQHPKIS